MQVRIKNYKSYPEYEGKIGEVIEIRDFTYKVRMADGNSIIPYKESQFNPQCELVETKLIVGNKYVPLKKSVWGNLESSFEWKKAKRKNQNFLYFIGEDGRDLAFSADLEGSGDFFLEEDVIPYEKIPEKWCIISKSKDQDNIINAYARSLKGGEHWTDLENYSARYYLHINNGEYQDGQCSPEYPEVTFEQFKKHILKQVDMLPERWCIKRTTQNFVEINNWVNSISTNGTRYSSDTGYIYSEPVNSHRQHIYADTDGNDLLAHYLFTEITFDQFKQFVLKQTFVLPTKWFVVRNEENAEILNEWENITHQRGHKGAYLTDGAVMYSDRSYDSGFFKKDYTEITFEQFKTHVLKQTEMKKVIGYKLKADCKQFEKAALAIATITDFGTDFGYDFSDNSIVADLLKKADVLDLWFEPVYEEEFKVGDWVTVTSAITGNDACDGYTGRITEKDDTSTPYAVDGSWCYDVRKATAQEIERVTTVKIEGYKLEKNLDGSVTFGCQDFSKETVAALKDLFSRTAFKFSCKVNNTEITQEILRKL